MKLYFVSGIILTVAYGFQIINPDPNARMKITVPVLILFFLTFFAFILEYETQRRDAWSKKEKKLIEESYTKFTQVYHKKKDFSKEIKSSADELKESLESHRLSY